MGHVAIVLFVILVLSIFLSISSLEIANCIPTNVFINVPYSTNAPSIDGQWSTTTEWNDASEYRMSNELGWISFLKLKHNETHVFALLDFISDQSNSLEDSIIFAFDSNSDGGNIGKPDDYKFSFYYRMYFTFYSGETEQGTGFSPSSWAGISQPSGFYMERGFSNIKDPYESQKAHSLFEAAFPLSLLNLNNNIGFYAYVNDSKSGVALEFPVGADGNSPGNWGNLVIERGLVSPSPSPIQSTIPKPTVTHNPSPSIIIPTPSPSIPEFPSLLILMVLVGLISLSIVTMRKRDKDFSMLLDG